MNRIARTWRLVAPILASEPGVPAVAVPGSGARSETAEDTSFYSVSRSPSPNHPGWIVALGWGRTCNCPVLFQSQDSGANWTPAPGPPQQSGSQATISLPPTYPDDSRIFVSAPAALTAPTYFAPRFGAPFALLPVPNGSVALSPGFDQGDDRVFVAGQSAVWSYSPTSGLLQPLVFAGAVSQVFAIASPSQGGGADLFVLASGTAPAAAAVQSASVNQLSLYQCAGTPHCAYVSTPPMPMGNSLSVSPSFATDHALEVGWVNQIAVSRDGGRSFSTVNAPDGVDSLTPTFIGGTPGNVATVWAVAHRSAVPSLVRFDVGSSSWRTVLDATRAGGRAPLEATAAGQRVIALLSGGGLSCTADGGASWAPRCPL